MNLMDITTAPLQAHVPTPVTVHVVIVLVVGGIITVALMKLPARFAWLGVVAAVLTAGATVVVAIDDFKGGGHVRGSRTGTSGGSDLPSECSGWTAYVDRIERMKRGRGTVVDEWNATDEPTPSHADALADRVSTLTDGLATSAPPTAATALHANLVAIFEETEKQLRRYADGGDFDPTRLNRLADAHGGLLAAANDVCGDG
jgi:hypothetical protein